MNTESVIPVRGGRDVAVARLEGRAMANRLGFSSIDQTMIATAISAVADSIVERAGEGEVVLSVHQDGARKAVQVVARDPSGRFPDLVLVPSEGHALGLGLGGTKRLMDEFEIRSEAGRGTTVTMRKWRLG